MVLNDQDITSSLAVPCLHAANTEAQLPQRQEFRLHGELAFLHQILSARDAQPPPSDGRLDFDE